MVEVEMVNVSATSAWFLPPSMARSTRRRKSWEYAFMPPVYHGSILLYTALGRYSLCTCISKCIGSTFTQNVVGTVHIGTDLASIFAAVQAVSPANPLCAKDVFFLIIGCVSRNRVKVNKARLTGIALFL